MWAVEQTAEACREPPGGGGQHLNPHLPRSQVDLQTLVSGGSWMALLESPPWSRTAPPPLGISEHWRLLWPSKGTEATGHPCLRSLSKEGASPPPPSPQVSFPSSIPAVASPQFLPHPLSSFCSLCRLSVAPFSSLQPLLCAHPWEPGGQAGQVRPSRGQGGPTPELTHGERS